MIAITERELQSIREYENNPRHNEKAVEAVAESIKQFGFKVPLVIDRYGVIIAGHTRAKAAERIGLQKVPCIVADDLTDEQIKAYRLADNKTADLAEWDVEKLNEELKNLTAFDMDAFGFDSLPDIMEELHGDSEEEIVDAMIDETEETICKHGDVWELGRHRLICGDCTAAGVIEKLMDGEKADLLLTDPPYNVAIENSDGLKIQNDNMTCAEFYEFLKSAFTSADSAMKDGAAFYIWHGESEGLNFRRACSAVDWNLKQCIIWVKSQITLGRQDYQWKHEPCLYGWKSGKHYFIKNRKQATVIDNDMNIDLMTADELREVIKEITTTVLREDKPTRNEEHPTMKPVPLIKKQVKNSTKRGGVVLDIFGGSGTTLLACEELERCCYMCELDEKYCDVIIRRWEAATGETALKCA